MANHTMSSNTFSATIFSVFSPVPVYSAIGVTLIGLDEEVILIQRKTFTGPCSRIGGQTTPG